MSPEGDHDATIPQIHAFFHRAPAVEAVAVFGSSKHGSARRDAWSDVVVIRADALPQFHPDVEWIGAFGALYTFEQSSGVFTQVTRCCFRDGRAVDFVFTTTDALERLDEWPSVPWWEGARILFSRSERVGNILAETHAPSAPPLLTPEAFAAMARRFRFQAMLAVTKVARGDLLIALHLALELQQECCVLGMVLRDRAEGTRHHRNGGVGNAFVAELEECRQPYTAAGILDSIKQCAAAFDTLAGRWAHTYQPDNLPLQRAITKARSALS